MYNWKDSGIIRVLGSGYKDSSLTNTLVETTLDTIVIPGGRMGRQGQAYIACKWSHNNSANSKRLRVKFGGVTIGDVTQTTNPSSRYFYEVWNKDADNAQGFFNIFASIHGGSNLALYSSTVNTAQDVNVTFTGLLANVADIITLEHATVMIIPGV